MRKEYIVIRIDAAPDNSPQVLVSLAEPKDVREKQPTTIPMFGGFGSMDDLMKNLNKIITSQMMSSFTTTLKLSIKEYEDSGIKVGDKIYLDIIKPDILSNEIILNAEQMQKYEEVMSILTDLGVKPNEWASKRNDIVEMINRGLSAKEIADAIAKSLK
ncbi:MAG: hypothetical protein QXK74_03755 [Candidatus Nitrosocaldaceae archaeon]